MVEVCRSDTNRSVSNIWKFKMTASCYFISHWLLFLLIKPQILYRQKWAFSSMTAPDWYTSKCGSWLLCLYCVDKISIFAVLKRWLLQKGETEAFVYICICVCVSTRGQQCRVVHGLGWPMGWVGSTIAKVLKIWKDYVNAFKARLGKIWLHQAVKFVRCIGLGRVGSKFFHL